MKKLLLILALGLSVIALGNDHDVDIVEDKLENASERARVVNLPDYEVEYDIDVYRTQVKYKIEIEGMKEPELNYKEIREKVKKIVKENAPGIKNIDFIVEFDPIIKKDRLLYFAEDRIK